MRWSALLCGLIGLPCLSCGDPTVDGAFRGEPLGTLVGEVQDRFPRVPLRPPGLRAAVFWDLDGVAGDGRRLLEDRTAGLALPVVPDGFVLNLFDPPPGEAVIDGAYALGRFVVYSDADGDGRLSADEPVVGGEGVSALLYAAAALPREVSPTGNPLAAGFHRVRLPLLCAPAPAERDPGDCGVDLTVACRPADQTCPGRAQCVNAVNEPPWPYSTCVLTREAAEGCRPAGGALVPTSSGRALFWAQACSDAAECAHPTDLTCDPGVRACVGLGRLTLIIENEAVGPGPPAPAYCATARP